MPREISHNASSFETEHRNLAYTHEFRDTLKKNPEMLSTAKALVEEAEEEYNPENLVLGNKEAKWNNETEQWETIKIGGEELSYPMPLSYGRNAFLKPGQPVVDEDSGMEVTLLGKTNRKIIQKDNGERRDKTEYFKINHKGQSYFVKKSLISNNPGFVEFQSTHRAIEKLKHFDFVKVVESKLGFQDKKESWYVSEWQEVESAGYNSYAYMISMNYNDYGHSIHDSFPGFDTEMELEEFKAKVGAIRDALKQEGLHYDLYPNLFYNYQTKKFLLLDVTAMREDKMVGSPWGEPEQEIH